MVEVEEKAFLEIERVFQRNRTRYYTFAVVKATGVAVRYNKYQSKQSLGFATGLFNRLTKGLDKEDKAVVSCEMKDYTWYYVIPTRMPKQLEDILREAYGKSDGGAMANNETGGNTP